MTNPTIPPVALPPKRVGWKTIIGAVTVALAFLLRPEVLAVLPHKLADILLAVGSVLTALGLRDAQAVQEQKTDYLLQRLTAAGFPVSGFPSGSTSQRR
jgi:hypothetical protein